MLMREMMSREICTLRPGDTLEKAVRAFKETKMDSLPVTGEDLELLGVFTRTNLYNALLQGSSLGETIDTWMTRNVYSVPADTAYETVEELVKKSPVGTAPVVDGDGRVVGVFTKTNMVLTLLRKSDLLNAQLKAILNAMHNGVVAFDQQAAVSLVNKGAERMLDLVGEECLGRPCEQVLPGLDLSPVLERGEVKIGIKYVRGDIVTIANVVPISDGVSVAGAVAVFQDLTELQQMARELEVVKDLNQTLDTVLNIIYDGIVVVDEKGRITLVNQVFADFIKAQPAEILGKHVTEVISNSRLHIVARTGVPETSEIQNIGDRLFIVSRLPVIKDGLPTGAVGKVVFPQLPEIQELVKKLSSLQSKVAYYQEELQRVGQAGFDIDSIIGISPVMVRIKKETRQIARGNSTVLITGESGTGKDLIAKAIHLFSERRNGPFVRVNCAAIPENLLETEIFGYAPGAFTGADRHGKPGRFEMADKGTIFFDEIGDMSLGLQAKLLRVIQEREFERVGGTRTIRVDVRIVSATNRDLRKSILDGTFREDLYYRLNVINLRLPPLRERREDIGLLVDSFIKKFNRILKTNITGISPGALEILHAYAWPGNVRELENVIERAANYALEGIILPVHLPPYIFKGDYAPEARMPVQQVAYRDQLNLAEKEIILSALDRSGGNRSQAARLLNMSRTRFYARLRKLGLM